ncbi:tetratricopeptide (TPR) repeat protein [Povalibacter uvarum]|uniref:Tetratricopeptide (TPR) repeat protein n=1 Tax=Povalibacter uvarum TaxID=732238 RepID=A0A841HW41_9GAMM|nr:hypothetical protein [Povalibacter uvarum]MBB6096420.1 tetratricopeptide (TPR) repeat protein [Povalibacter uvarum]
MRSVLPLRTDPIAASTPTATSWLWVGLWLLPALVVVLVWLPSLSAGFQFDDWNVIVHEPKVHSLAAWWASMPGIRPLLKLSYAAHYAMGPDPIVFRVFNMGIHALSAMLVFWLLQVRGVRAGLTPSHAMLAGLLAALIFAIHPVQTEAVTYISGRSSSLSAFFCLVALWCWVRGDSSGQGSSLPRKRESILWSFASCAAFIAAVACKETALILPLALWLYSADGHAFRRLMPLFALVAVLLLLAASLPRYRDLLDVSLQTRSITENLLTQSRAVLYLAGQLIRPWNMNADPELTVITQVDATSLLLCSGWSVALGAALWNVRRKPIGAFAVLWFLLWLAPTNSLLPRLDPANDRQLYLAMIGPAWWLSVQLIRWAQTRRPLLAMLTIALVLGSLCAATIERNRIYETEVTFWEDTAARNPANARAANNLAMAYAMACRREDALREFDRAISLDPSDFRARINRKFLREGELPGVDEARCGNSVIPAGHPLSRV